MAVKNVIKNVIREAVGISEKERRCRQAKIKSREALEKKKER